jgi:hypothetical protein
MDRERKLTSGRLVLLAIGACGVAIVAYRWSLASTDASAFEQPSQRPSPSPEPRTPQQAQPLRDPTPKSAKVTDETSPSNLPQPEDEENLSDTYEAEFVTEKSGGPAASIARTNYLPDVQSKLPKGSRLESFECRAVSCRMEVTHDTAQVSNEFLQDLFLMERGGPFARSTGGLKTTEPSATPDKRVRSVAFFTRAPDN